MIIIWQWLLKNTKISGITLYPFILLRSPELRRNRILLNHEKIHLRQQLELLIVLFTFGTSWSIFIGICGWAMRTALISPFRSNVKPSATNMTLNTCANGKFGGSGSLLESRRERKLVV